MRSDARRNRDRLLTAARELILAIGGEPSRDAVAQRAGVGIATLYRHFPDRQDLLRAVVLDVLERTIAAGQAALAEGRDAPLATYLHAAIDTGLGAVNIIHPLLDDTDWPDLVDAANEVLEELVSYARRTGEIRDDITATDITHAAIRFARPLAIGCEPSIEREIAHRQLYHHLAGLRVAEQ